jgi:hypothetical protein
MSGVVLGRTPEVRNRTWLQMSLELVRWASRAGKSGSKETRVPKSMGACIFFGEVTRVGNDGVEIRRSERGVHEADDGVGAVLEPVFDGP